METSRERQRLTEAQKVFSKEYGGFKRISWEENGQVSQAGKGMLVLEPGMFIEEQFTEKEWALVSKRIHEYQSYTKLKNRNAHFISISPSRSLTD